MRLIKYAFNNMTNKTWTETTQKIKPICLITR